jgi:hypothetical protein
MSRPFFEGNPADFPSPFRDIGGISEKMAIQLRVMPIETHRQKEDGILRLVTCRAITEEFRQSLESVLNVTVELTGIDAVDEETRAKFRALMEERQPGATFKHPSDDGSRVPGQCATRETGACRKRK